MKEILEVRMSEEEAEFLPADVGELSGHTRVVTLGLEDPLLEKIREQELEHRRRGSLLVTFWDIHRKYSAQELRAAELLLLNVRPYFVPTGEDCGTVYDESSTCPGCGQGARQVGPLHLDVKQIPKRDIARTAAGELVVSARLADEMRAAGIRGYELGPVVAANGKASPSWHQLLLPSCGVELSDETRVGRSIFFERPDEAYCPGHVLGSRVLSEVTVRRSSLGEGDWHCSRQVLGQRFGTFRPWPLLFISPRLYQLFVHLNVKRFDVEVVHLV